MRAVGRGWWNLGARVGVTVTGGGGIAMRVIREGRVKEQEEGGAARR